MIPLPFLLPFSQQLKNYREKGMRERGYKRKSIDSQAFRQERLKNLQSQPLWGMAEFLVIPALRLITCIWLECIFQESIQFGFEDVKGGRIPCFVGRFCLVVHRLPLLKVNRLEAEGPKSWFLITHKVKRSYHVVCLSAVTVRVQCYSSVLTGYVSRLLILSSFFGLDVNSLPSIMLRDIRAFFFH